MNRGLDIIEALASEKGELEFSEISKRLKIPRASLARILNTLRKRRFIDKDEKSGRYRLGLKFIYLVSFVYDKIDIRSYARPYMVKLAETTGETIELSTLDHDQLVLVEQIESEQGIRLYSRIGSAYPYLHTTAPGKVYLSQMSDEKLERVLNKIGLPKITENTITEIERLKEELKQVAKKGFAFENQELRIGVRRFAAPIFNHENRLVACLGLAGPFFRIGLRDKARLGRLVKNTADEISRKLGAAKINPKAGTDQS